MRVVLLVLAAWLSAVSLAPGSKPNIIFILADDLGWRDLGCYGSTFYETPHLDRLAERGMRFPNAYAASPLCSPTRASLLTGLYPARLGFTKPAGHLGPIVLKAGLSAKATPGQRVLEPTTCTRLSNDYLTYAEVLKERGYRTAFMGKWHLDSDPYLPDNQGFDLVVGGRRHPGPPGGYFAPWPIDTIPKKPEGTHIDDVLAEEAVRFLRSAADAKQPFLLNLWFYSVHAPFEAKAPLLDKYRRKAEADPRNPQASPMMGAMIETLDTSVGRVLAALEESGLADNTLVLFTSDNGGNNYNFAEGVQVTNNAPLRNGKGNNHEGGQRVPFLAAWPGRIKANSTSPALVTSVDFYPSILAASGAPVPEGQSLDGHSFLPLLEGKAKPDPERAIFTHFPHGPKATGARPSTSVRQGDWKLLRFYADGAKQADRHALYNLAEDIGEQNDLALRQKEVVARLAKLIDRHLADCNAVRPAPNPDWQPSADGWTGSADAELRLERDKGILRISSTGNDPFIVTESIAARPGRIRVEIRCKSDLKGGAAVYFATKGQAFGPERRVKFLPAPTDGFATSVVEFTSKKPVHRLRIDPGASPGEVEIDFIRVLHGRNPSQAIVAKHWDF